MMQRDSSGWHHCRFPLRFCCIADEHFDENLCARFGFDNKWKTAKLPIRYVQNCFRSEFDFECVRTKNIKVKWQWMWFGFHSNSLLGLKIILIRKLLHIIHHHFNYTYLQTYRVHNGLSTLYRVPDTHTSNSFPLRPHVMLLQCLFSLIVIVLLHLTR